MGSSQKIERGTLASVVDEPDGTKVEGFLEASGSLDLSWTRRLAHGEAVDAKIEHTVNTVVTVGEGLANGVSVFDVEVSEGEIDRLDLRLPAGAEVLTVTGAAVLQWRTEGERDRLTVLLRYLVRDEARVAVTFQYPVDAAAVALPLRTVLPADGQPFTGHVGVQAPPGFDVSVAELAGAQALGLREIPSELAALTSSPLLFGFSFTEAPAIALGVKRLAGVELTSTIIDELQASTLLLEDGVEVTKLRLDIRNNRRQYLAVTLPVGAALTHALLDGQPVRPATRVPGSDNADGVDGAAGTGQRLLFALRQSQQINPATGRQHRVQSGETLGAIAHRYYSDPEKWPLILDANRGRLNDQLSLRVGMDITIPSDSAMTVEESAFSLELAYRRGAGHGLGNFGVEDVQLPTMDVDTMKVTWHLYLPRAISALDFDANLTQYTKVRYGVFERIKGFLDEVFGTAAAYAGGGKYESILNRRRVHL